MNLISLVRAQARPALGAVLAISMGAGLMACSNGKPVVVNVNLDQAKTEAQQIDAAVAAALAAAQPQLNASQQANAAAAQKALDAAVAQFVAVPSGAQNAVQIADEVLKGAAAVVNAVPVIPPQDRLIIDTAIAVLDAFVTHLPVSLPAPAPAAA